MIEAYQTHKADAIGMSGLLVKSTLIMRDNLDELARRGLSSVPVLLGGAALTRKYVEHDLAERYPGTLMYGKDAFAGLRAMEWITGHGDKPESRRIVTVATQVEQEPAPSGPPRSPEVSTGEPVPRPPFIGSRIVKGIPIDEITPYLNTTALFRNQWQFRPENDESDDDFKARLAPELRRSIANAQAAGLLNPQVAYGHFHANSDGDTLIIWKDDSRSEVASTFEFPRQGEAPWLCISDFFRDVSDLETDVASFHIVTMGDEISKATAELFAQDRYEEYLKLHGIGVELTEALAEYWHTRIRAELGIDQDDADTVQGLFRQKFQGGRYSWGYPACPDLEDNLTVAELLGAERLGIEVGPETGYQYQPEQTTSAIICHHPQAKYFIARKPRDLRADQS